METGKASVTYGVNRNGVLKNFTFSTGLFIVIQVAATDNHCLQHAKELFKEYEIEKKVRKPKKKGVVIRNGGWISPQPQAAKKNRVYKSHRVSFKSTKSSSILWQTYKRQNKTIGILKLIDFTPTEFRESLEVFRDLLLREFKNTDGVVIDVRGNTGGFLSFAECLLFNNLQPFRNFSALGSKE